MKKLILTIIPILFILSCTSSKKITERFEENLNLPYYNPKLTSLQIEGNMDVNMPSNNVGASFETSINKLDEFKMNLFGPFGIEVAKLYSNSSNFIFYNMFQGEAYGGVPSSENLNKVANIALSFKDLVSIMRCEIPSGTKAFKKKSETPDATTYHNKLTNNTTEKVIVNKYGLLTKYELLDESNKSILSIDYLDYKAVDKFKLAHKINISFPKIAGKLELEVDNYKANVKLEDLKFNVPKSIKVKEIK